MIAASQFKKGVVITLDGAHWVVEDYHVQKSAQRHPVLHVKLRNMKSRQVVERTFNEADKFEQPELQTCTYQYLYADGASYVFMDAETFDQITVPAEVVGHGKWLLKEGMEFVVRLVDGRLAEVVLPPTFVEEVVETGERSSGHGGDVWKDAKLACGLTIKVPQFIKVGDHVNVDTENHKYHGKESGKR